MEYQSSRTAQIRVETTRKFAQKKIIPIFRAIRKHAKKLGLSVENVRFLIDEDTGENVCCYLENNQSLIKINIDSMIYGVGWGEYVKEEDAERIVAHEMRHAWQYATGVLQQTDTHFIWNGVLFPRGEHCHWSETMLDDNKWNEYLESPWEIDARKYSGEDE